MNLFSKKHRITASLFLIGALHTMIFVSFLLSNDFLQKDISNASLLYSKIIFYLSAVGACFFHQRICRFFGLKNSLIVGLFFNLFGLLLLEVSHFIQIHLFLLFLEMVFFGIALTSVLNSVITFILLQFPKHKSAGLTAFVATLNGGALIAPYFIKFFTEFHGQDAAPLFLIALTFFAIVYTHRKMYDPPFPKHLQHLRHGSILWKELHYRLGLYLIAMIAYGMIEGAFSHWGFEWISIQIKESVALEVISIFWVFTIISQFLITIPIYFFSEKKVFYTLTGILFIGLYFFYAQTHLFGLILGLAIGGLGCSGIFPLLIGMVEKEIASITHAESRLPYIESAVALMIGAYVLGSGVNDIWIIFEKTVGRSLKFNQNIGLIQIIVLVVIGVGLTISAPKQSKT